MQEEFFEGLEDLKEKINDKETDDLILQNLAGAEEWKVLAEISDLLNASTPDLDHTLDHFLHFALDLIQAERGLLMLFDEDDRLVTRRCYPLGEAPDMEEQQFTMAVVNKVMEGEHGVYYNNLIDENHLKSIPDLPNVKIMSCICVPLKVRLRSGPEPEGEDEEERRSGPLLFPRKIVGVLYADSHEVAHSFSKKKLHILQALGNLITTGIINSTLYQKATQDSLTRLYMRPYFESLFRDEMIMAQKEEVPFSLLMIDLDGFRHINESWGHQIGDEILAQAAQVIRENVRRIDICARYGGDEFVVLLPQTPADGAESVGKKILNCLAQEEWPHGVKVQASGGLTEFDSDQDSSERMAKRADQALYSAKERGGNQLVTWTEDIAPTARRTDKLAGVFTGNIARDYRNMLMLLEAISKVNSTMQINDLLVQVVDMILEITGAERAIILLEDKEGELETRVARDREKKDLSQVQHFSRSIPERVLSTGQPVCLADTADELETSKSVESFQLRTVMCVPLLTKDKAFGVIYVDSQITAVEFTDTDLAFFEALAHQIAVALENARLFEQSARRAERLSKSKEEVEKLNQELAVLNKKLEKQVSHQASELEEVRDSLKQSQAQLRQRFSYHNIVGRSTPMQNLYDLLDRISDSSVPVLIYGKSGTGKELVAKAIHYNSPRQKNKIVSENCAAMSESLLESELFGHVKGAFTGADRDKKGLFQFADNGTLFLDEVGDMSLGMQKKLLRVLQENRLRPLGSNNQIDVDVRIIAATNRDLRQLVEEGKFRQDLYYRLNVVNIKLPPLCDRKEDIPLLIDHFLDKIALDTNGAKKKISSDALAAMVRYKWPGNVRELENEIKKLVVFSDQIIQAEHLSPHILDAPGGGGEMEMIHLDGYNLKDAKNIFEYKFIERKLVQNKYNVSKTARDLDITRQHLHRLIETYNIDKKPKSN